MFNLVGILHKRVAYPVHGTLGFARGTHSQGPRSIAKPFQILVKAIKLRGRPYDTSCPSNFISDMVFIRCLNVTQKHKVNHQKLTKKMKAGVEKL